MTKIVWLAIALMLLSGMTVITAAYACESEEGEGHPEGECSNHAKGEGYSMSAAGTTVLPVAYAEGESHAKGEGHPEGECSGHAEGEGHAKGEGHPEGECSGHGEGEGHAKGEGHSAMKNLSDEQRAAVHAKIKAMKAEGATHAEIRAAVKEMLKEDTEAKVQATEDEQAASPDVQKENGNGRNWLTKTVFAIGYIFKAFAGAVVGILS